MGNFENLLTRLIEHQVEFVLVGGFAATAHGSTLLTQDVDICTRFSTDLGQLDCLGAIQGVGGFEQVNEQSIEVRLPAGVCRVLSLDALIRSKEAMGRPRDKESLLQLRAIRQRRK
jgi:hypothetical protein